jgi:hypothetical protein
MIVVLCYFPFIHFIENKILSKILAFIDTLQRCGKITNTHTLTGLFQVFNQKKKKKKNYDVSTTLLLAVAARANEQTDEAGETTKRKTWTTSSNREENVCMYVVAIG